MSKAQGEIRRLLTLLGGALLVALLVVGGLLYVYGPSGTHLLRGVLLSPDTLKRAQVYKTGHKKEAFVTSTLEFVRVDPNALGHGRFAVSLPAYRAFYDQVSSLRSIPKPSEEILALFRTAAPSTLTLLIQREGEGALVQRVEFQQDFFRVKKRRTDAWIYYRKPGIYAEAVALFVPEVSP